MTALLFAVALAAAQAPEAAPVEPPPPPLPRGPRQPSTGAAAPELVAVPRICQPFVEPSGPHHSFERCFLTSDYPLSAFEAREQGVVAVRVEVSPQGRATACAVTQSSGSAALDAATCTLLERRISISTPSIRNPVPVATTITGQVAWTLPPTSPRDIPAPHSSYFLADDYPPVSLRADEQGVVMFTNHVSAAGRVTLCEITRSSGAAALDQQTCRIMRARARYYPARDAQGRQVPGVDPSGVIIWRLPEE